MCLRCGGQLFMDDQDVDCLQCGFRVCNEYAYDLPQLSPERGQTFSHGTWVEDVDAFGSWGQVVGIYENIGD